MLRYSFFVDGVERTLVECNDNYAIYRIADGSFELHKLRWRKERTHNILSRSITEPEGFYIASTAEFGMYGFHCMSLETCALLVNTKRVFSRVSV